MKKLGHEAVVMEFWWALIAKYFLVQVGDSKIHVNPSPTGRAEVGLDRGGALHDRRRMECGNEFERLCFPRRQWLTQSLTLTPLSAPSPLSPLQGVADCFCNSV